MAQRHAEKCTAKCKDAQDMLNFARRYAIPPFMRPPFAWRPEIAVVLRFAMAMPIEDPPKSLAISETLHCDLRARWKVASDLRFRVAISEADAPSFCISGDLAPSTWKNRQRLCLCDFGALSPVSVHRKYGHFQEEMVPSALGSSDF